MKPFDYFVDLDDLLDEIEQIVDWNAKNTPIKKSRSIKKDKKEDEENRVTQKSSST